MVRDLYDSVPFIQSPYRSRIQKMDSDESEDEDNESRREAASGSEGEELPDPERQPRLDIAMYWSVYIPCQGLTRCLPET